MRTEKYIFVNVDEDMYPHDYPKENGVVYVNDSWKIASFRCPCGCYDLIELDINPNAEHPRRWSVNGNTIHPSINRSVNCMSHFFITNGLVKWEGEPKPHNQ